MTSTLSRRDLLKAGGAIIVSFRLGRAQGVARKSLDPKEVDSFLALHADGTITIYCGKVDVGTGLRIAVRQMAAEELGIPVDKIELIEGDTALTPDQGSTGGSTGLTRGGVEIRQAAATARQALLKMPPGAMASGKQFNLKIDPKAPLVKPADYKYVGKPIPRPDIPAKCTGTHVYVQDFVLPGMLHGRVVRPPSIGSKLLAVDEASIRRIPDVRVVRKESFLGVVAKDEWAAIRAARELRATWSEWQGLPGTADLERFLRDGAIDRNETVVSRGDTAGAMPGAAKKFSATYHWPNQSHASLGPSCAVADVKDGGTTVWSATQGPHALRQNLSKVFGIPADKLRVVFLDSAGSYGGNGNDDVAGDAVLLSKSVGAPVRVQWMRQDEHGWDPKGPQQLLDIRTGIDADGKLVAWETEMWVPAGRPGARPMLGVESAGMTQDHGQGAGLLTQNADPPYAAANVRVVAHQVKETPLRPSNLRAPGKIANAYAVESLIGELASAAGIDAVEYRLRGLSDPRGIAVIKKAAEMFGWQSRTSPNPKAAEGSIKVGRGLAYVHYKQAENYVAIAMEAAVDTATGKISVQRVTCAHDCGLVVNPMALKNQIEGCIMQTLSRSLHEEVKFDRSRVTSVDWISYPILTFPEVPAIEVALIDRPELPLHGAGEAASAPVAAALANAVFDATGAKLRIAPFIPERVKAALARAGA